MSASHSKKYFILSVVLLLLTAGLFTYAHWYVKFLSQQNEENLALWRVEAARREEIRLLNSSAREIEGKVVEVDSHFASSGNVVPFLDQLERMGRAAGGKAEVSAVDLLDDGATLEVELHASGSFSAVYKLLRLLESGPYELQILSLDMGKVEQKSKEGAVEEWQTSFKLKLLSFVK